MLTDTLSFNSTVVQKKGNVVSNMDGCKVMFSVEQGKYYNLGSIGGTIWDIMESPIKVNEIVRQLVETYEVEEEICSEQAITFINQLIKEALVLIC